MLIGTHDNGDTVTIGGEAIEVLGQFEYLGRILLKDSSDMPAIENRIGKACGAFEKSARPINFGMLADGIMINFT